MVEKTKIWGQKLYKSVWLFPVCLLLLFSVFVIFKISGTSIGYYQQLLNGSNSKDSSLVSGSPRGIRSDEWLVWTQLTISQSKNGFDKYNPDLGSGRDLSLHFEIPTDDWSAVFKPQNWSFLILPLEYAFAFKWWYLMFVLICGAYFFALRFLPGKCLLSALLATAFAFSPFVLWWYQSPVLGVMGYGFFILLLVMQIIEGKEVPRINNKKLSSGLMVVALSFLGMCFAVILYPPFQISIALMIVAFSIGYLLKARYNLQVPYKTLFKRVALLALAAGLVLFTSFIFINDKKDIISSLSDSVYPGERVVPSGSTKNNPFATFGGFLTPLLQSSSRASNYYTNQSEASQFILLSPFLIVPAIFLLVYQYKRDKKINWLLFVLVMTAVLLMLRVYVGFGDSIYKLLLLDKVPHRRLMIAFGFLGYIMTVVYLAQVKSLNIKKRHMRVFSYIYASVLFAGMITLAVIAVRRYPQFVIRHREGLFLAVSFSAIYYFLIRGWRILFAFSLLGFTMLSSFRAMPLYQGLGPLYNSQLVSTIEKVSEPEDDWIVVGQFLFEQVPLITGNRSFSGVQIYPVESFWIDKYGEQYKYQFDRKGHITYRNSAIDQPGVELIHTNQIQINFSCKDTFIMQEVEYVLSETPITNKQCVKLLETVSYPAKQFYIYKLINQ